MNHVLLKVWIFQIEAVANVILISFLVISGEVSVLVIDPTHYIWLFLKQN